MQPATQTEASKYVEQHLYMLRAYTRSKRFRPCWVDADDFLSDVVASVLTSFDKFRLITDPAVKACSHCGRRGCSTWIGWRVRGAATRILRRRRPEVSLEDDGVSFAVEAGNADTPAIFGTPGQMFAKAHLNQLFERATSHQADALQSRLEEWDGEEIWKRLGISSQGRNYHLRRLVSAVG